MSKPSDDTFGAREFFAGVGVLTLGVLACWAIIGTQHYFTVLNEQRERFDEKIEKLEWQVYRLESANNRLNIQIDTLKSEAKKAPKSNKRGANDE
jgi:hypothetical protein